MPEGRGGYDPQGKASCNTLVLSSGAPARHSHLGPPQSRRIRVLAFADVLLTQSLQLAPPSFDLQDVRAPGEIMFHKIAKLSHVSSTNEVGDQCKQSQIYRQLSLVSRLFMYNDINLTVYSKSCNILSLEQDRSGALFTN